MPKDRGFMAVIEKGLREFQRRFEISKNDLRILAHGEWLNFSKDFLTSGRIN